jgi:hypothetical protein
MGSKKAGRLTGLFFFRDSNDRCEAIADCVRAMEAAIGANSFAQRDLAPVSKLAGD